MFLSSLDLKLSYRSNRDDIVNDFYYKVLSNSIEYKRAVGYFSTNSFLLLDKGLDNFIENKGKVKLIASPQLSKEDIESIAKGYELRKIVEKRVLESIFLPEDELQLEFLSKIEQMIALGNMDIKIAACNQLGIFHEKIGIVNDVNNDMIAFTGSLNETGNAFNNNFESIDLFLSWDSRDLLRVQEKNQDFDNLWNDTTEGLEVIDFTKAIHKKLLEYKQEGKIPLTDEEKEDIVLTEPGIPPNISIREYQEEAYKNWVKNGHTGIYEMATGTGKTITACYSLVNLYKDLINEKKKQVVIVLAPFKHLVDQWENELKRFGYSPIKVYSDTNWQTVLSTQISRLKMDRNRKHLSIITTNDSFKTPKFTQLLNEMIKRFDVVLVADEAHNVGADTLISKLPCEIKYKLGLTATPVRHNDENGTHKLLDYFRGIVYKFSLKDAIDRGFLTKYYYYPQIVYLDKHEYMQYSELLDEFKGLNIEALKRLSFKDSKFKKAVKLTYSIADGSINKFKAFKELMKEYKESNYNLVYCSSVNINDGSTKFSLKQISAVTAFMGNELKMNVHTFTAEEDISLRKHLIKRFSSGNDLQSLIAIKCLDEGVDIPATRRAFILSSTTNQKQFVQRRGRVLRKSPGKEFAEIFDFVTLPRELEDVRESGEISDTELFLVAKEYNRIREFASLAINSEEGMALADLIKSIYNNIESGVTDE